jgi:hypothetical protein
MDARTSCDVVTVGGSNSVKPDHPLGRPAGIATGVTTQPQANANPRISRES